MIDEPLIPLKEMPEELIRKPHRYIRRYYEAIYPHLGGKTFAILSLMPVSLIMPRLKRPGKTIKSKINILLLGSPGGGKTSIANEFEKVTYHPLAFEYATDSRLDKELSNMDKVSLIISDISRVFENPLLVKQLEGVLDDDGIISRLTMHNKDEETKKKIDAIAYFSGTPENIYQKRIRDGLLSRVCPMILAPSEEEHEKIVDFVSDSIGEESKEKVNYIPHYYEHLYKIQEGEDKTIKPVVGFTISKQIKDEIKAHLKPLIRPTFKKFGIEGIRELEETYRFMCAHAFLNIFQREIKNNKIVITKNDLHVAKVLIKYEIDAKYKILESIAEIDRNNFKNVEDLREWVQKQSKQNITIGNQKKFMMEGMLKG